MLIILGLFTFLSAQERFIEIVDDAGQKASFPESFIKQSEAMRAIIEEGRPEYQEPYSLPANIPLSVIKKMYESSKNNFSEKYLIVLVTYYAYAHKLLASSLEKKIITRMYDMFYDSFFLKNKEPEYEIKYARSILDHYMGLASNEEILKSTNILRKKLSPDVFQATLQKQLQDKGNQSKIAIADLLKGELIFTLPIITAQPTSEYSLVKAGSL